MSKLQSNPRLPIDDKISSLKTRIYELFRGIAIAHNDSYMWETSGTAAPSSGTWAQGDKCMNTAPSELGLVGTKYVVIGWVYSGSAWLEMRNLTGN